MSEKMTVDEALLLLQWAEEDRDQYKAEVERLRKLVETVDRQRIANGDEVARLRAGMDEKIRHEVALNNILRDARLEVGRLRTENATLRALLPDGVDAAQFEWEGGTP